MDIIEEKVRQYGRMVSVSRILVPIDGYEVDGQVNMDLVNLHNARKGVVQGAWVKVGPSDEDDIILVRR
jgi:hypothetical protein